jgi:hypothetical protein
MQVCDVSICMSVDMHACEIKSTGSKYFLHAASRLKCDVACCQIKKLC